MSVVSAKAFIEKVKTDEDFKKKLGELKDGKERMEFVKSLGFNFTKEEIAKAKEEEGLTDEELDNVAGGCGGACIHNVADFRLW